MFSRRVFSVFIILLSFVLIVDLNIGCKQTGNQEEFAKKGKTAENSEGLEDEELAEKAETGEISDTKTEDTKVSENPRVLIETSMGNIEAELFPEEAPVTVENFLAYVNEGFYNGTIFHRVVPNFMIQGGGFTPDLTKKPAKPPIKNEATNKLSNLRGTVAMARTAIIESATSQFFINLKDNLYLNHKDETPRGFGYCVFGKVINGMDVAENIVNVPTTVKGQYRNVPETPVVIKSISLLKNQ